MCMSESSVNSLLKKETGRTLIAHVQYIRIQQAMLLLRTTTDKVSSIGYSVGFESPNDFCRIFKQETGMTPVKFRGCVHFNGIR